MRTGTDTGRERYRELVEHVWERLEQLTGYIVFYLGPGVIAAYCPACLEGTVRIRFVDHPRPGIVVGGSPPEPDPDFSEECNREMQRMLDWLEPGGRCSRGCTEAEIAEALQ